VVFGVEDVSDDHDAILEGVGGTSLGSAIGKVAGRGTIVSYASSDPDPASFVARSLFGRAPGAILRGLFVFEEIASSLRTGLIVVGLLSALALGVALYSLLADDESDGNTRQGASSERVSRLDDRVDRLSRQVQGLRSADDGTDDLEERVDSLSQTVDSLRNQTGSGDNAAAEATQAVEQLDQRVDDLSRQIQELRQSPPQAP
jgi:outer membrane murein-binding lipoprotein Lpp